LFLTRRSMLVSCPPFMPAHHALFLASPALLHCACPAPAPAPAPASRARPAPCVPRCPPRRAVPTPSHCAHISLLSPPQHVGSHLM
jgi:hypothetical protein